MFCKDSDVGVHAAMERIAGLCLNFLVIQLTASFLLASEHNYLSPFEAYWCMFLKYQTRLAGAQTRADAGGTKGAIVLSALCFALLF